MGSLILDQAVSMGGRWLQSLAGSLASGSGLLLIAAVLAGLYLFKKLSKKIAEKIGIGLGPLLAVGVLAAACFGLFRARSQRPASNLPPEILAAKQKEAVKAEETRERWADFGRAQADLATLDAGIASMPMGGQPMPGMMMMAPSGPMPAMPHVSLPTPPAFSTRGTPGVSHSSVAASAPMAAPASHSFGGMAPDANNSASAFSPHATAKAARGANAKRIGMGMSQMGGMSGGMGMGSGPMGGTGDGGGPLSQGSRPHGRRGMSPDQVAAMQQLDAMTSPSQFVHPGMGMHPAAIHAGGGHPTAGHHGMGTHPGMTGHGATHGGHPLGRR